MGCLLCNGLLCLLGTLGKLVYFRCRNCGSECCRHSDDLDPAYLSDEDDTDER